MSQIYSTLNPPQLEAVTLDDRSALILAGAGSGKTRVLTLRIVYLLQTQRARAGRILAVTFTNKAAKEMLHRLVGHYQEGLNGLWLGTFHGLCHRMLRTHSREAGLNPHFEIIDTADQLSMIKAVLKEHKVNTTIITPRQVQNFINHCKERGVRPGEFSPETDFEAGYQKLYHAYEQLRQEESAVDFADLLLGSLDLLRQHADIRARYRERFRYLLVDEFQDTSTLQYEWLKTIAGPEGLVMAVGDDDQSIYSFRGANIGNMRAFQEEYCGNTVIRLEQNYRSHGSILTAANSVIAQVPDRFGKKLWTDRASGPPIVLHRADNDTDEANWIVHQAKQLHEGGLPWSHIAVLYRANAQSRSIEHALFTQGIPYRVWGSLRFFERQEIKNAIAYLRLVQDLGDDGAFLRVVNVPPRGVGSKSIEKIRAAAFQRGCALADAVESLSGKTKAAVQVFLEGIKEVARSTKGLPLTDRIGEVLERSGLREYYAGEPDRLSNLDELIGAANAFGEDWARLAEDHEADTLQAFLTAAALESGEGGQSQDGAQLMTVHAAKGLEFDCVFIAGLEEGLFPHENALKQGTGLDEERRLMYVALTRAKEHLFLSSAADRFLHGQWRFGVPSRFIDDIPASVLLPGVSDKSFREERTREPILPPSLSTGDSLSPWAASAGKRVRHRLFGEGYVLQVRLQKEDAQVQVRFDRGDEKWLMATIAGLEVL